MKGAESGVWGGDRNIGTTPAACVAACLCLYPAEPKHAHVAARAPWEFSAEVLHCVCVPLREGEFGFYLDYLNLYILKYFYIISQILKMRSFFNVTVSAV